MRGFELDKACWPANNGERLETKDETRRDSGHKTVLANHHCLCYDPSTSSSTNRLTSHLPPPCNANTNAWLFCME